MLPSERVVFVRCSLAGCLYTIVVAGVAVLVYISHSSTSWCMGCTGLLGVSEVYRRFSRV